MIGDCHGQRNPEGRTTQRNGYRARQWDTRVGVIDLQISKLRQGSYFPHGLPEPRKRGEQALLAVIQQAYASGVSTRRVDQLLESLGLPDQPLAGQPRSRAAGRAGRGLPLSPARGRLPLTCGWTPRCATRRCWIEWGAGPRRRPSQRFVEAEGSPIPEPRVRAASGPDNDAARRDCRTARARQARWIGETQVNQWQNPLQRRPPAQTRRIRAGQAGRREPAFAGHPVPAAPIGAPFGDRGGDCVTAVAGPQGQSWAALPPTERQ